MIVDNEEIAPARASASLDRFQPKGLPGISGGGSGSVRIRAVSGADGPASSVRKADERIWGRSLRIVGPNDGDTYRAMYTVRFETAVYVLHAFMKKSKRGIATPTTDVELVKRRLRDAEIDNDLHLRKDERQ